MLSCINFRLIPLFFFLFTAALHPAIVTPKNKGLDDICTSFRTLRSLFYNGIHIAKLGLTSKSFFFLFYNHLQLQMHYQELLLKLPRIKKNGPLFLQDDDFLKNNEYMLPITMNNWFSLGEESNKYRKVILPDIVLFNKNKNMCLVMIEIHSLLENIRWEQLISGISKSSDLYFVFSLRLEENSITNDSYIQMHLLTVPYDIIPHVVGIDCSDCGLLNVPGAIAQFHNLHFLHLDRNDMHEFPMWLKNLDKIRLLSAQNNAITSLKCIPVKNLEVLLLQNNALKEFDVSCDASQLLHVNLAQNEIQTIGCHIPDQNEKLTTIIMRYEPNNTVINYAIEKNFSFMLENQILELKKELLLNI